MTHLEVQRWATNADLIEAVFEIHVWPKKWRPSHGPAVMDVTYGRGLWWRNLQHTAAMEFTAHDMRIDSVDYRALPEGDEEMDVIAFDPDYIAPGGRKTSTIGEFNDRYGLKPEYETPATLQQSINSGLSECARVVRPQGLVLAKTMNYISSGKLVLGEYEMIRHGLGLGLKVEDIVVHLGDPGPQPKRDSAQKHFRSNSSRLIIFRKPGRRSR
jgi:hypothetical protein